MLSYSVHRGNFIAKNRLIRSATLTHYADKEGHFNDKIYETYHDLAMGGVGTIIVEVSLLNNCGAYEHFPRIDSDDRISEYNKLASVIHEGDCLAIAQLNQANYVKNGDELDVDDLSTDDIEQIIKNHADGARRAKEAGFDGVEIHAAHGFLLSRFLNSNYNHRSDKYGEDKNTILGEVFMAIRDVVGYDFAIWIKLDTKNEDCGITGNDCVKTCKYLSDMQIGAIELSCTPAIVGGIKAHENEGYNKEIGMEVMRHVYCPVILVGGIRSLEEAEEDLFDGFEAISLSRPLLCEPDLPGRWLSGDNTQSKCTSCNSCRSNPGHGCILNK
ncbi:NADH:flavin oxidoreductase [Methanosphaera sp.]